MNRDDTWEERRVRSVRIADTQLIKNLYNDQNQTDIKHIHKLIYTQ